MSIVIAFRILKASLRGTEVAIYDYALANEEILHNRSIIVIATDKDHNEEVIKKFTKRFPIFFYDTSSSENAVLDIENILKRNNCKILYTIAYGERKVNDPTLSINNVYKTALHCVFSLSDPHADTYVPISNYLAKRYNSTNNRTNVYVPHIISLLEKPKHLNLYNKEKKFSSLRDKLGIPQDALVFGRYGGIETFNLQIAHNSIKTVMNNKEDIYFIFINTYKFIDHPRVIFLDPVTNKKSKIKFIMACDAMIHARSNGETFGLACGEFSVCNKPIITCNVGDLAHIDILKERCIIYDSEKGLENILLNFKTIEDKKEKELSLSHEKKEKELSPWTVYDQFNSENVSKLWWKYLIEPLIQAPRFELK